MIKSSPKETEKLYQHVRAIPLQLCTCQLCILLLDVDLMHIKRHLPEWVFVCQRGAGCPLMPVTRLSFSSEEERYPLQLDSFLDDLLTQVWGKYSASCQVILSFSPC